MALPGTSKAKIVSSAVVPHQHSCIVGSLLSLTKKPLLLSEIQAVSEAWQQPIQEQTKH